jgi:tRNA-splicing ligase RtcB
MVDGVTMIKVISTEKHPIKLWLDNLEDGALRQAKNLANLPFVFKWVAIMPDAHQGYGMPIGAVLAACDTVVPNAVGVDIGCGVSAVRTSLREIDKVALKAIMGKIRAAVPTGFDRHAEKREWGGFAAAPDVPVVQQELHDAHYQLGTLGGGNHFIELQKGSDGRVWVMLHSGSRNFGLKIARAYHEKAVRLCEKWRSDLPDNDLAFLPMDTNEAHEYFAAMSFACNFAKENRAAILKAIISSFAAVIPETAFDQPIDIRHNYAAVEKHFNRNVIIHRKGAISARTGEPGLVPGSQGTKSYIVRGLGNPESFASCAHGAGRKIGRKQAQRELDLKTEQKLLDDQGIIHGVRTKADLDEATGAYKPIGEVMENQKDLVEISIELSPMGVIKG